jgi:hypothetical protein
MIPVHNYTGYVLTEPGLRTLEQAVRTAHDDQEPQVVQAEAMERGKPIGNIKVLVAPNGMCKLA